MLRSYVSALMLIACCCHFAIRQVRFHVIVVKAEYIIDFSKPEPTNVETVSSQPCGVRSKGKTAAVFHAEGSPTVAGALSQEMDISHRIEVCDTPAPSIIELGNFITGGVAC
ncbi:uncharacterized protein BKA55DRAFT_552862 [Fusarium redolens]|uniref:Secreted protein n=1 Tax=Fusarium redolens TaxID=48865 RepID=A0A9P9KYE5_FUSRE|nr:uncharacterized protein BKA55DRAFT_552862 [Fusarium redolens]KAH7270839.1 hypothetical protein BKA55DRAFT_552862 [Fusarium redolens]